MCALVTGVQTFALPISCDAKAFVVNGSECQHVLLRGRAGSIRLDVFSGSLLYGPVSLVLGLAGMEEDGPAMVALRRFLHLRRTGRLPALSTRACQRLRRQVDRKSTRLNSRH